MRAGTHIGIPVRSAVRHTPSKALRSGMRKIGVVIALVGALAACSTKTIVVVPVPITLAPAGVAKYRGAAVKAFTDAAGTGSSATCDAPTALDVGTTFKCTGTGADGSKFDLVATIDEVGHVLVNSAGATP